MVVSRAFMPIGSLAAIAKYCIQKVDVVGYIPMDKAAEWFEYVRRVTILGGPHGRLGTAVAKGDFRANMGRLTTHVLDTAQGKPGAGIRIDLYAAEDPRRLLASVETNDDGRCDAPLLADASFKPGIYELVFHAGAYFDRAGMVLPDPPFIDQVVLRFGVAEADGHYHVPLLLSPWGYTTYRGS
jgi:5-hydroxyisourate hydrolase